VPCDAEGVKMVGDPMQHSAKVELHSPHSLSIHATLVSGEAIRLGNTDRCTACGSSGVFKLVVDIAVAPESASGLGAVVHCGMIIQNGVRATRPSRRHPFQTPFQTLTLLDFETAAPPRKPQLQAASAAAPSGQEHAAPTCGLGTSATAPLSPKSNQGFICCLILPQGDGGLIV